MKSKKGKSFAYEEILKHLADIEQWARDGASESEIAKRFGISRTTFWQYKKDNPNILNAIKNGRMDLARELKTDLLRKAHGFTYEEKKVTVFPDGTQKEEIYTKYALPDVAAIHLLLKNIDADWRNDDQTTLDLKREKLEMEKQKLENESW